MKTHKITCGMCELLSLNYSHLILELIEGYAGLDMQIEVTDVNYCPRCGKQIISWTERLDDE